MFRNIIFLINVPGVKDPIFVGVEILPPKV
jgi:hypothetical protein